VRAVVFQGTKVIAWGTAHPLEDGQPDTELGALDEGYASRVYSLLSDMGFKRLRLITELPLYTPLVRCINLPNMKPRYFNEVVQSELLDTIPFSSEEVDVVWQRRGDKSGHEVLAVVVPRSGIDHHIKMLRQANFRPGSIYAKAISLAASVGQADVIIVYASVPQAAVLLVRGGFTRVVHQVDLPDEFWPYREHAQLLSEAVEQVSGFQATVDGDQNQESPLPVVLIGPLAVEDDLADEFRKVCKRDMLPFQPAVEHPEYFSPYEYASNIGLILADRMRTKSGGRIRGQNLPAVNLMAQRHLPKPLPFKPVAVFMSIAIFGAVAFNMTPKVDSTVLEASSLATEVENLERQTRLRRLNLAQMEGVQEQIEISANLRARLENRLGSLESDVDDLLARIDAITIDARPFGLRVSTLSMQGDEVSLSGTALSYESVIEYTANLRDLGTEMFSNVRVQRVASSVTAEAGNPDVFVLFQVKATLPESLGDANEDDEQGVVQSSIGNPAK
jgi:Tfp pilus assembly protein PilN